MSKKTVLKLIVGLIVTVVVIYCSVRSLSGLQLKTVLNLRINWGLAAISTFIYMYANYVRGLAYSWGIDPKMDHMTAFRIVGIGHAANMVLPLHIGEGLRYVFFPTSYSAGLRAKLLIIPAFADFLAIMILSVLAVPFAGFRDHAMMMAMWILSAVCIAVIVLSVAAVFFVRRLREYVKDYLNFSLVKMMFWVMLSWVMLLASTWIGLIALGYGDLIEVMRMSLAVFAATNIINFIPASPGSIGLFEYATILALKIFNINDSDALVASLFLHVIQYVALIPMGLILYFTALHGKYGAQFKGALRRGLNKEDE